MVVLKTEYTLTNPLNREPPLTDLVSNFLTKKGPAYNRNHSPIPHIDASTHHVQVTGLISQPLSLSITQLKYDFPQHEVACALQCAGNRRHTMRTTLKEVSGIDWGDGAVMNCVWRGPKLRDVLTRAGVAMGGAREAHVAFASFQIPCQEEGWYGGSITLEKAMRGDGDVILALEMNEHALSAAHGAPVRIIAPGIAGARSVKWLDQISVQLQESQNYYQIRDYKVLPPEATDAKTAEKFWKTTPALQEMPINSVIAYPAEDSKVKRDSKGAVQVGGYALPQGDQGPVTKVEISVDDGRTWQAAQLITEPRYQSKWCWVLWKATVKMSSGSSRRFLSRAIDAGGNVQTAHPKWNFRGVAYNGYGESKKITIL